MSSKGDRPVDTLESWLRQAPIADPEICAALIRALLLAVQDIHWENEIQHSLDPRVIRLKRTNEGFRVVGLGPRHYPEPRGCAGPDAVVQMNLRYLSPEYVRGRPLDERHDHFLIGIFLFELVTGRHPFPGDSDMERLTALLAGPPADVPSPNPELLKVALRMLRPDPDERRFSDEDWLCELEDARLDAGQRVKREGALASALTELEDAARGRIVPHVRAGLRTRDEIVDHAADMLLNTGVRAVQAFESRPDLNAFVRGICARIAEQVISDIGAPPPDGDCERLDNGRRRDRG